MIRYSFTSKSNNEKLTGAHKASKTKPLPGGRWVAATMAPRETCPDYCPHYRGTCYGEGGPLAWTWGKLDDGRIPGLSADALRESMLQLPEGYLQRLHQVGDWPSAAAVLSTEPACEHTITWTYTHRREPDILRAVQSVNRRAAAAGRGLCSNVSTDSPDEASHYFEQGFPVVMVGPSDGPKVTRLPCGGKGIQCPATWRKGFGCGHCRMSPTDPRPWCAAPDRGFAIVFPAHGVKRRELDGKLALKVLQ